MFKCNIYDSLTEEKRQAVQIFSESYKAFLNKSKTERLATAEIERLAIDCGFRSYSSYDVLNVGDKVYFLNRGKNIALFIIGNDLGSGMKILGAHLDAPRLDLKACPVFESNEFILYDTHYYGSIKNYQYVTIPLEIHGVVYTLDGGEIEVHIGDNEDDPVVGISDLAIHLAYEQLQKNGRKVIESEDLDVIIGTYPYKSDSTVHGNQNLFQFIKEKYGILEEDYISAELEIIPSIRARDFGLDRTMIAGYAQDDRASSYAALRAILDIQSPDCTSCAIFVDKEEVGSIGATSAESVFFENCISKLLAKAKVSELNSARSILQSSHMLSCDAMVGLDPIYDSVSDKNNSARLNYGIVFEKYLGFSGKSATNDASPEYLIELRKILNDNDIHFQVAEIARVDQGGGSSLANVLAKYNIDIVDCGIPVLNMHSPMEIIAKNDLYESYLFYKAFLISNIC